jgi:hypothetical protein
MIEFVPPSEVFEFPVKSAVERTQEGAYDIPGGTGQAVRTKDGEMCTMFSGFPYPRKGAVYAEAILSNNEVKRKTMTTFAPFACKEMLLPGIGFALTPFKWKIRFLEKFLDNYVREVDIVYFKCTRVPYLKKEYYCNLSKALWDLVSVFMQTLGFSFELSEKMGKIFATQFEYDDAYKIRVEDPFSEFIKEEVLADPVKFVKKFMRLAKERDVKTELETMQTSPIESITHKKFEDVGKLLQYALYHPKIKKAFKRAMEQVNFPWLQLDELEIFWNLNRLDYNMQGRTLRDRYSEYVDLIADHLKKVNNADAVQRVKNDNGTYSLNPMKFETVI